MILGAVLLINSGFTGFWAQQTPSVDGNPARSEQIRPNGRVFKMSRGTSRGP